MEFCVQNSAEYHEIPGEELHGIPQDLPELLYFGDMKI
jgi:hypothetical protein